MEMSMRRILELAIASAPRRDNDWERANAAIAKRIAPLLPDIETITKHDLGFTAELTPSNIPPITQFIMKVNAAGKDMFNIATLTESLEDSEAKSAEWFILHPKVEFNLEMRWNTGLTSAKADKQKPTQIQRYATDSYFSESARSIIERHKLRGLEYVWVRDTGKFHAPQWFHIFAIAPLGRGIDHPWFDPK